MLNLDLRKPRGRTNFNWIDEAKPAVSQELQTIDEVFCALFGEEFHGKIRPETTMDDIEPWDSFSFIDLISLLEDRFEMTFEPDEMAEMYRVDNIVNIVQKRRQR